MLLPDTESANIAAEASMRVAQYALIGVGLTALISLIVAIISLIVNSKTQSNLKTLEFENNKKLAEINANLEKSKSEDDARRDYDYDARKRLYKECEPLFFRLTEASINALYRVVSLARTARWGALGPEKPSWLGKKEYYMASTVYTLLLPVAIFRLIQNKLTMVDLTVDKRISDQYSLAKWIYLCLTEDFELAEIEPALPYKPFTPGWETKRLASTREFWREGIGQGRLDAAVGEIIITDTAGQERVLTFGEFEKKFYAEDNNQFHPFGDIFLNFHPADRPVLWRILITQALLFVKLVDTSYMSQDTFTLYLSHIPRDLEGADLNSLNWTPGQDLTENKELAESIKVAKAYLKKRLSPLF